MIQDVIDKSLKDNPSLQPYFNYWMEPFVEDGNYEINLGTKLNCLSSALVSALNEKSISIMNLKNIFNNIEDALEEYKERKDEDFLGLFEVMFFENISNWVSNIEDEKEQSYYNLLVAESLGPISKKLCESNQKFWQKVILHKNFH